MGQYFSNKYQKYRRALEGKLIERDLPCPQCEYNLRGLKLGGVCPECGTSITVEDPFRDSLSDAPVRIIRRLCLGFWVALLSLIGLIAAPFAAGMIVNSRLPLWACVAMVLSAVWTIGIWMITRPIDMTMAQQRGFDKRSLLRITAATMQLAWPTLAALLVISAVQGGGPSAVKASLSTLLLLIGLAGLSVLAAWLTGLAQWMYDRPAHRLLNIAMWGIPISSLGILLGPVVQPMLLFACIFAVLWIVSMVCFARAMFTLGLSVSWSLQHAGERAERDRRLRTRREGRYVDPETTDEKARRVADE